MRIEKEFLLSKVCLLTFDVEEWFQVANLKGTVRKDDWELKTSTVEKNTSRILNILEKNRIPATFFILGWVAERQPEVVKTIYEKAHEIASHGYAHELANQLPPKKAREDLYRAKKILEEIISDKVFGYRAPNFSINDQILEILKDLDFLYDSSFNPFGLNPRYGTLENIKGEILPDCFETMSGIYEVPISTYSIGKIIIPIGGGAYFRIFPFWIFKNIVKARLKQKSTFNLYLHPWELEPEQERIKGIRWDYRFRHYYNLKSTEKKLEKLIIFLKNMNCQFITIRQYIKSIEKNS